MDPKRVEPWFTQFLVEADGRPDSEVVWGDSIVTPAIVRAPTTAERYSILAIGGVAIGGIVLMVVALIAGVYISRR